MQEYDISPENSYNMDEKGFLIGVLCKMQRVYLKEAFQKGNIVAAGQDGNREWITLIATICVSFCSVGNCMSDLILNLRK